MHHTEEKRLKQLDCDHYEVLWNKILRRASSLTQRDCASLTQASDF